MSKARTAAGYSIRVAARLTGLPAETLRMWERRYGFPHPARRDGGARLFSDDDIATLQLVGRALLAGFRPGEIVGRPRAEIERALAATRAHAASPPLASGGASPTLDALLDRLVHDDASGLRRELHRAALALGPKPFVTEIAQPLAVRVGDLWEQGKLEVRHEHLLSEALSTQLRTLMSAFEAAEGPPTVLLATLPDEPHGIGLVMTAVFLAASGASPRLLGVSTPPDQIVKQAVALGVDVIALAVTLTENARRIVKGVREVRAGVPSRVTVWLGGGGAPAIAKVPGVRVITSFTALDEELARVRSTRA